MTKECDPVKLEPKPTTGPVSAALPELLRPNFFAGQLLTSDDLTALGDWVSQRLSLKRQSEGWGVVCGLEVNGDPQSPKCILLSPGHAVDPSGRDIVVRQEQRVCLDQFCAATVCADGQDAGCVDTSQAGPPADFRLGGFSVPGKDVRAIDLWLHYAEEDRQPRPVLPRPRTAGSQPACAAARKEETFYLRGQVLDSSARATQTSQTQQAARDAKVARRDACLQLLNQFGRAFPTLMAWKPGTELAKLAAGESEKEILKWLSDQLLDLRAFPFVLKMFTESTAAALPWKVAEALFWLILSCHGQHQGCGGCPDLNAGVPLARVWLYTNATDCRVLFVDSGESYRRGLTPPFITNDGQIDLSFFYGKMWSAVDPVFLWYGVNPDAEQARLPASLPGLAALFSTDDSVTTAEPGQPLVALVSQVAGWEGRAIGFFKPTGTRPTDLNFELKNVTLIPAGTPGQADDRGAFATTPLATTAVGFLQGRTIPVGAVVKLAATMAIGPPVGSFPAGWDFLLYDSLSGTVRRIDLDFSGRTGEVIVTLPTFTVAGGARKGVQFALLAAKKVGTERDVSSTLAKDWEVAPPSNNVSREFALEYGNTYAPGETITYTVSVTNAGNNAISGKFQEDSLPFKEFSLEPAQPNQPKKIILNTTAWIATASTLKKTIKFLDLHDDFGIALTLADLPIAITLVSISFKITPKTGGGYDLKVTAGEAGIVLNGLRVRQLSKPDGKLVEAKDSNGAPLSTSATVSLDPAGTPKPFTFDAPDDATAGNNDWLVIADFQRNGDQLKKKTPCTTSTP